MHQLGFCPNTMPISYQSSIRFFRLLYVKQILCVCFISLIFIFFPLKKSEAISIEDLQVYGYLDEVYSKSNNAQGNKNGSFDLAHFNLLFDFPLNERWIVKSHIEFQHGVDTERDFGTVKIEWNYFQHSFIDEFKTRGGQTVTPFGIFNEVRDTAPAFLTVEAPQNLILPTTRGGFSFYPEHNKGFTILGNFLGSKYGHPDLDWDYTFYIGNGENRDSVNAAQFDDNVNKAIGGRFQFMYQETTQFGVSFYSGDRALTADLDSVHHSLGAHVVIDNDIFNISVEGAYSKFDQTEEWGGFAQGSFTVFDDFFPYYRFEFLNPDASIVNDNWETHIIGINWNRFAGVFMKFEWNFHNRGINNKLVTLGQTSFNEVQSSISIAF